METKYVSVREYKLSVSSLTIIGHEILKISLLVAPGSVNLHLKLDIRLKKIRRGHEIDVYMIYADAKRARSAIEALTSASGFPVGYD